MRARMHWVVKIARKFLLLAALALVGALLCATMVRFAPGFGVDERGRDSRRSRASIDDIRSEHQVGDGLISYYGAYISGLLHGKFGNSTFLQRPVGELLKERAPFTVRAVLFGLLTALVCASGPGLFTTHFSL